MQIRKNVAVVAAGAMIVVGLGATGAVADRMIGSKDIKKEAVKSKHIADGTIKKKDLRPGVREQLKATGEQGPAGPAGPAGEQGPAGEPGQDAEIAFYSAKLEAPKPITNIGGPINNNATKLGTDLTLPAGTYQISVDGDFISDTAAADGAPAIYPQLSLWLDKDKDGEFRWQDGEGSISPNALMPTGKNMHIQVSGTTTITLAEETSVSLLAFGYAEDQSAARSGEINVNTAEISALKVD